MKQIIKILAPVIIIGLMAGNCWAAFIYGEIGSEITIPDLNTNNSSNTWYNSDNEDQETEPGTVPNQLWDLEGMFLNSAGELTLIGGYDFLNGVSNLRSGDIFINTSGADTLYGDLFTPADLASLEPDPIDGMVENIFGYNFVLDLHFPEVPAPGGGSIQFFEYDIYSITPATTLLPTSEPSVGITSNPWRYGDGGVLLEPEPQGDAGVLGRTMTYYAGLSDTDVGFLSDGVSSEHFALTVDISDIVDVSNPTFLAHFTMQCGNDNLMGDPSAVPEPFTALLLGSGLMGIAAFRRFKS